MTPRGSPTAQWLERWSVNRQVRVRIVLRYLYLGVMLSPLSDPHRSHVSAVTSVEVKLPTHSLTHNSVLDEIVYEYRAVGTMSCRNNEMSVY